MHGPLTILHPGSLFSFLLFFFSFFATWERVCSFGRHEGTTSTSLSWAVELLSSWAQRQVGEPIHETKAREREREGGFLTLSLAQKRRKGKKRDSSDYRHRPKKERNDRKRNRPKEYNCPKGNGARWRGRVRKAKEKGCRGWGIVGKGGKKRW